MDLHLQLDDDRGLADQIYTQLRDRIGTEALPAGTVLPSSRRLAERLAVSRATVVAAYERLAAHGLIRARAGVGTIVTGTPPARTTTAVPADSPLRAREIWLADELAVPDLEPPEVEFDFALGVPARSEFPFARWRALLNDQLRRRTDIRYADPAGSSRLREVLARHLVLSRGLRIVPEQLVITAGAQQGFDLAARLLLEPGDTVAVEDPGYLPAYRSFLAHGARAVGVRVDREGLVVDEIPDGTRLVYVTPSHQFPLGMPLSEARRTALLEWAARHDAAIVEDDYDSEFRFAGRPLTPLQAIDDEGRVLYVGSFSKTLLPALRVGFLGVPAPLAEATRRAKAVADYGTAGHVQSALATFVEDGDLARHIRRMRRTYETRHHLVTRILHEDFAEVLDPVESSCGTHMTALLEPGTSDTVVAAQALAAGLRLGTISRWSVDRPGPHGFVFGYGAIATDRIEAALAVLRRVI